MRKIAVLCAVSVLAAGLFAQAAEDTGQQVDILLPALSSTVESAGVAIESDAIPDFSLVLPLEPVELPGVSEEAVAVAQAAALSPATEQEASRDIYFETSLSLGLPSSFAGNFALYRSSGALPFSLSYGHETVNAYGKHTATEGYNNSRTAISGNAQVAFSENCSALFEGSYLSGSYGLQGRSASFYNLNTVKMNASAAVNYRLTQLLTLDGTVAVEHNTQFAGLSPGLSAEETEAKKEDAVQKGLWVNPGISLLLDTDAFSAKVNASYSVGSSQNRLEGGLAFSKDWGGIVDTELSAGVVVATNAATKTVFPFAVTVRTLDDFPFPLAVSGGLSSSKADFSALSEQYPYVFTDVTAYEETEWFGGFSAALPVAKIAAFTMGLDFAQTAFGNGRLLPRLDAAKKDGLYTVAVSNVTALDSTIGAALFLGDFKLGASWNMAWIDNPRSTPANCLLFNADYAGKGGVFGAQTQLTCSLGAGSGLPAWNLAMYCCLSSQLNIELAADDILNLFTGKDRVLPTGYVPRGGCVRLSAHVYF